MSPRRRTSSRKRDDISPFDARQRSALDVARMRWMADPFGIADRLDRLPPRLASRPTGPRDGVAARWTSLAALSGVALLTSVYVLADRLVGTVIPASGALLSASLLPRLVASRVWYVCYLGLDILERSHESELRAGDAERRLMASDLRAAQAESLARENELRHLQAQMNPHLLFNAVTPSPPAPTTRRRWRR